MTVGDWIRSRTPAPPAAMTARIVQSLGRDSDTEAGLVPQRCLDAAVELLERLLARDALERSAAIDLLAADALVTYAFEAAAANPGRLEHQAAEAMVRLAALAERDEQPAHDR